MTYDEERAAQEFGKLLDGKLAKLPLEEAVFTTELMHLAEGIEPDAAFTATLEARLRAAGSTSPRPTIKPGVSKMTTTYRLRPLAFAAAALALIALVTLTVPPLRSMAQDIINLLFSRAATDTQVFPTPIVYDVQPTPVSSSSSAPQLSIAQVKAQAGFDVLTPAYLPAGYTLEDASLADTHLVSLLYTRNSIGLNIVETPAEYAEALDVGASAEIVPVQIGNATGQLVQGYWRAETSQDGSTLSVNGQTWDSTIPFQQLRWEEGDMVFWMSSVVGQSSDLSLDEWVAIAESLR